MGRPVFYYYLFEGGRHDTASCDPLNHTQGPVLVNGGQTRRIKHDLLYTSLQLIMAVGETQLTSE